MHTRPRLRRKILFAAAAVPLATLATAGPAGAATQGAVDTGDTAWLLTATALVMFMTPGLAFFYSGLVRPKNVLTTIMQCFVALGVITVVWVGLGYTLAFGDDVGGVIGNLDWLGFRDVGGAPGPLAATIPHSAYAMFQMMFAIITPALIAGAFAERMKFSAYVAFIAVWSLVVYSPLAHWVWGGGFIGTDVVALDFAGGTVVHINAGMAALAAVLLIGRRQGWPRDVGVPHNVPFVVLGASILWFGWFGFNAGSALTSGGGAADAFTVTHVATAAAIFGWVLPEWAQHGKPTTVGAATGAVAGLVAITPAAGFVRPWSALIIGFAAGAICYYAVSLKSRLGYDDSLDVVGVHFVGGAVGALLTGVFAIEEAAEALGGTGGLVYTGSLEQLGRQFAGVGITMVWSFVVSLVILKAIDVVIGLRVPVDEEEAGLDLSQHGEAGYTM